MAMIPKSATNTARTIYSGLGVVATSKSGKSFTHATRELGPIGKRIHSFLQSGPENSLGRRAITTARAVMDFRGRGIGRLKDLPQGAATTSEVYKTGGPRSASARASNPHGYVMGHVQSQLGGRTRVNLDPSPKGPDYRIQGYFPRGMGGKGSTAGIGGQFFTNKDSAQFIRNRNRRVAGNVAAGVSVGVANASVDRRGYNRRQPPIQQLPDGRIGTPKGLGRNA